MSGPLVIHGATIVTADDAGTLHPDGALAVEHGRIVALGPPPTCSGTLRRPSGSTRAAA